jgi:putative aminopeptidase FrvX
MKYVDLLNIQTKDNTAPIMTALYVYLQRYGKVRYDLAGNLWFERGLARYKPLIVAHCDTVQEPDSRKVFYEKKGKMLGRIGNKQTGIGADDRNGIFVALMLIKKTNIPLKCLFTFGEETGAHGAYKTNETDFDDVAYMLEFDRKGSGDIINYGSDEFLNDVATLGLPFGYKETFGVFTDVTVLSEKMGISAVNLSCGYYYAHTQSEYTVIGELYNAICFGVELITNLKKRYDYTYIVPDYNPKVKWSYPGHCAACGKQADVSWSNEYWDYLCDSCKEYFEDKTKPVFY